MIGYADNYDFIRSSSCTGIWLMEGGLPKRFESNNTVNGLVYTGIKNRQACMKSVDNLIPLMTRLFHEKSEPIDFKEIALVRILLLIAFGFAFFKIVHEQKVRLAFGAVFLIAISDMAVLPYFNTLYLEFSVLVGCFFSVASAVWLSATNQTPEKKHLFFFIMVTVWFGLSKNQYGILSAALALYMAFVIFKRWRNIKRAILFVAVAVTIPPIFAALNNNNNDYIKSVAMANTANTFLVAVLPAAKKPDEALELLGLPPACQGAIGFGWFSENFAQKNPCREVFSLSRWKLLKLFAIHPETFYVPFILGIQKIPNFYPSGISLYEDVASKKQWAVDLIKKTSLTSGLSMIPTNVYMMAVITLAGLGILCVPVTMWLCGNTTSRLSKLRFEVAMIGLGGVVTVYAVASSVFGDGYLDIQKHAICIVLGIAFQLIGIIFSMRLFFSGISKKNGLEVLVSNENK